MGVEVEVGWGGVLPYQLNKCFPSQSKRSSQQLLSQRLTGGPKLVLLLHLQAHRHIIAAAGGGLDACLCVQQPPHRRARRTAA